ncbi:MAG TPA: ABC transporter ATP-binding protein [Alphaproteobacteria bacterium]|nr:ABC transporter ATP-binding protein [Alphaproteobacteria bacterium]
MALTKAKPAQHRESRYRESLAMPAVELQQVSLAYPSPRAKCLAGVHGIDLSVTPGEIVALLGPSGCGKTTTLRLIAGLERPDSGMVTLRGQVVSGDSRFVPAERRQIGFMFQDFALFPHLTVIENVAFGLKRLGSGARRARALEALGEVGLADRANDYPDRLSGGQKQRVALARALAPGPSVVLLDEPFSGLDAGLRHSLRADTVQVLRRAGCTVILVTHDAEEAMFMADRIALMRDGEIEQIGTPTELYSKPATAFAAAFFGEVNRFHAVVQNGECWTPAGMIETPDLPCGTPVEIVVRPEQIHIESGPATCGRCNAGSVALRRSLGRSTLYQVSVDGGGVQLTARTPQQEALAEGDEVNVSISPGGAMIFEPRA